MLRAALALWLVLCGAAFAQQASAPAPTQVCAGDLTGTYPNCIVTTINGRIAGATMYASTCSVNVTNSTPTSTFCPVGTDPNSITRRTYAANVLTVGKSFSLNGGGVFTVPTGNLRSADISIMVGSSAVMTVTTPAAPVGTNAGVDFHAICTVRTTTTMNCNGVFSFVVIGGTPVIVPFNQTSTFDPTQANLIDVLGDWNGATTSHITTVTQAVLTALN